MKYIPADTFLNLGRGTFSRHHPHRRRSRVVEVRRFKAHFGCTPERCAQLWNLLQTTPVAAAAVNGGLPKHLLWALLWLKIYNTDEIISGMCGCDEKTFRKWYWKFVVGISNLNKRVVRSSRRAVGVARQSV